MQKADIAEFLSQTPELYSSLYTTKSNFVIPVFSSGRTMESRYSPQSEADRLVEVTPTSSFYIVLGIGSGILVDSLLKKHPEAFFLCIEKDDKALGFLMQLPLVSSLKDNPHIKLTTIQNLCEDFEALYVPAVYGGLYVVEQKGWIDEIEYLYALIQKLIKASISNISADFSVQSHFGKIWQKNILNNLKIYSELNKNKRNYNLTKDILKKKAAIIAAGPSLDNTVSILSKCRENYFIISILKNQYI